jgi:integrase
LIEKDFKGQLPPSLSAKSVRNILLVLRESAVDWDYPPANPFRSRKSVKLPKPYHEQKGRALTPDEIRKLLDACMENAHTIVATAVLSGMLRAEIFGPPWESLDFKSNQIHVKQLLYWKTTFLFFKCRAAIV